MPRPAEERLEPSLVRAAVVVVLGCIMAILDTTIVAVALHRRSIDFRSTVSTFQWVTTGYLLSLAIVIPLSDWAIRRLGAKRVYMIFLVMFVVGSALCAGAWSASSLIFFRVLQGFGGGMLMMAPEGIGAAVVMRQAGSLADRHGPRYVAAIGMAGLMIGTFLYTTVDAHTSYYFLVVALFVRGIGLGFGMMPVIAASYRNLTHTDIPQATSATNIVRQISGSLGVAVFAVVLDTQIGQRIGVSAGAAIQNGVSRATPTQLEQIARTFGHSFWWSCGTCALGIDPAFFLPRTPLAGRPPARSEPLAVE